MKLFKLPAKLTISLIKGYQLSISPDHGFLFRDRFPNGFCRHYPSCSEYAKQSIGKFGLIKGGYLGIRRVIKCNPFTEPSIDLVPKN